MRATLIYPGITDCGFGSFGKYSPDASCINYGLAYISAYAKKCGHQIDLIDLRRLSGWKRFKEEIARRGNGLFGVTGMSIDYSIAEECFRVIKQVNRESVVVLGGVHATVLTQEVAKNPDIDHIIVGEGEISFAELLSNLETGKESPRIIRGEIPDIDALPWPDRELFRPEEGELKYPMLPSLNPRFTTIVASRGCPYKCKFCQPAERMIFGGKARFRSVDNVMNELVYLRDKYHFDSLLFHDDLFLLIPRFGLEFATMYRELGFTQPFAISSRADVVCRQEQLVESLAEVGLHCLIIGFESGSQRLLDFIGKGTTIEQNWGAAEVCRKYGIKLWANYMLGLPTETREEVLETVNFIKAVKPDHLSGAFFVPTPATDLYDYCVENDLMLISAPGEFRRDPDRPKIKGVDYQFLNKALSISLSSQPLSTRLPLVVFQLIRRYLPRWWADKTLRFLRFHREVFRRLFRLWRWT